MLDYLGHEIRPGDLVVYPGRCGSSLWMTKSLVLAIDLTYRWGYKNEKVGRIKVFPEGAKATYLARGITRVVIVGRDNKLFGS